MPSTAMPNARAKFTAIAVVMVMLPRSATATTAPPMPYISEKPSASVSRAWPLTIPSVPSVA